METQGCCSSCLSSISYRLRHSASLAANCAESAITDGDGLGGTVIIPAACQAHFIPRTQKVLFVCAPIWERDQTMAPVALASSATTESWQPIHVAPGSRLAAMQRRE